MKKLIILSFLLVSTLACSAQFFQGWGIMAGGTFGKQRWYTIVGNKEKSKFLTRYNGEVFAEFVDHPTYRWVTELQYNVKGGKWENSGFTDAKYKSQYVAWNNYLMIRHEMVSIIPYAKVGPRLEYVFSSDLNFRKFHYTGALGAGVEFVAFGPVAFITEAFWVPDILDSYNEADFRVKQHCWELRVGLKFSASRGESCPKVYR